MNSMDDYYGDEDEIESLYRQQKDDYEDSHADDWKYSDERLNLNIET